MLWLAIEALLAGSLLVGIVWWTMPKKDKNNKSD